MDADTPDPSIVLTSGQHAYVFLDTASRETGRGFQLLYAAGCHVTLSDVTGGTILSPGFGSAEGYPNFLNCVWRVKSVEEKPFLLKVADFKLEESKDFLKVSVVFVRNVSDLSRCSCSNAA